ncbi:uncharacterized protein DDB_G0284671-like [Epinephelus fuscoguttatus]|uniref:uncharacterized protein DDB_G0284671-like n=1 Tax=Epinephelus fuscoguttatus TaxID=293821 RepID=UPI0020D182B2|nr:uncharacterized protein DDB_G0284671-like [Epinephelus fuscoguttatus]XP_049423666.1 uncharacterized protein DDB_G0284671-like [Epinephelus fuscoguttatus]
MPPKKQKIGKDIRSFFSPTDSPARGNLAPSGGSQPGGAQGSQSGGATRSQQGGAKNSQSGGATRSQQGGAQGSQSGGPTGPQTFKCNHRKVKEKNDGDPWENIYIASP